MYDVSCGKDEEVVGGATIHLFNMKKQLKTGKHKLRLWVGKEADGSINTNTPGKVLMCIVIRYCSVSCRLDSTYGSVDWQFRVVVGS